MQQQHFNSLHMQALRGYGIFGFDFPPAVEVQLGKVAVGAKLRFSGPPAES
jgi:hypothetical protein